MVIYLNRGTTLAPLASPSKLTCAGNYLVHMRLAVATSSDDTGATVLLNNRPPCRAARMFFFRDNLEIVGTLLRAASGEQALGVQEGCSLFE